MKKLAIIFPGVGYTSTKPLLYYTASMAAERGYEIIRLDYGQDIHTFHGRTPAELEPIIKLAIKRTLPQLENVPFSEYDDIIFISKSIGTVIASAYASRHNIKGKSILFTPLTDTFSFARPGSIAFHGTADPWAETDSIRTLAEQKEVPLFLTPNANHSLETGDVQADLSIIKATMEHVNRFIATP